MIINISKMDGVLQVACIDYTVDIGNTYHLEMVWTVPDFLEIFPDLPLTPDIESVSYETHSSIYHVCTVDGGVKAFPTPVGHVLLEWIHTHSEQIIQDGTVRAALGAGEPDDNL